MLKARTTLLALAAALVLAGSVSAADLASSLTKGTPELKSAGPLAFGPEGILFIGDTQGATIFAVATNDKTPAQKLEKIKIAGVNAKIANSLGVDVKQLTINDLATNPISGVIYLSVTRGQGAEAKPVIVRVDTQGKISEFPLKDVMFSKAVLTNAADGRGRQESITQISFVKDRVIVAGLSNEDWASKLRAIPFPFKDADKGAGIQIWHSAHGKLETAAPVRTFVAYDIGGETNLLAAYTCTPLVKIPISQLKAGEKVKGTTVAELGNRNKPLDMIVYQKGGKDYLLLANSARGVMKVSTEGIDKIEPITKPVAGGGTAGLKYETIASLKGVQQLDKYGKDLAVVLLAGEGGMLNLEAIDLP